MKIKHNPAILEFLNAFTAWRILRDEPNYPTFHIKIKKNFYPQPTDPVTYFVWVAFIMLTSYIFICVLYIFLGE